MSDTTENTTPGKTGAAKPKRKRAARKLTVQEFSAKHNVAERRVRRVLREKLNIRVGVGNRHALSANDQKRLRKALGK